VQNSTTGCYYLLETSAKVMMMMMPYTHCVSSQSAHC